MRQFFMITLVALATGLMPAMVRADNPNQEAAKQIRDHLHDSGQLVDYKIAVRYLNGTVWLQGHVRDQDQLNKAVALVFSTQGVAINQVIRDELTFDGAKPASPSNSAAAKAGAFQPAANPLRGTTDVNRAQALPSSFNQANAATPVAMMQPVRPRRSRPCPLRRCRPGQVCRRRKWRPACRALRCRCTPRARPRAAWPRCVTIIRRCRPMPGRAMPPIRTTPR